MSESAVEFLRRERDQYRAERDLALDLARSHYPDLASLIEDKIKELRESKSLEDAQ